jgi:phosphopantothenoylcysteine decarboxylase / phosphopantothenate---cysteine ligase
MRTRDARAACCYTSPMRILITAGPTREPIDAVRYIANRSSGGMGQGLAAAAIREGHFVTLILGPVSISMPKSAKRIDVETSREMHAAVLEEFPHHDLLIMAAAVSDYRPLGVHGSKLERGEIQTIELEPTEDILAAAGAIKRPDQRTIGFSLVDKTDLARSVEKLQRKHADLIVSNPLETINSPTIEAVLLWPDGRSEELPCRSKPLLADKLLERAVALF